MRRFFLILEATDQSLTHERLERIVENCTAREALADGIGQGRVSLKLADPEISKAMHYAPGLYNAVCNAKHLLHDLADNLQRIKAVNDQIQFVTGNVQGGKYPIEVPDSGPCETCGGNGWIVFDENDEPLNPPPPRPFTVVLACEDCHQFADDLEAAKAWGQFAHWEAIGEGKTRAIAMPKVDPANPPMPSNSPAVMEVCGENVVVASFSEYPRGLDGKCAFCGGDPCAERQQSPHTPIAKFHSENPRAGTCPCCEGRPT